MYTNKGMGMIAIVVVGDDVSNKDVIAKAKVLGKSKKEVKSIIGGLLICGPTQMKKQIF